MLGLETLLANNCTCSTLENAFAQGLGAGWGSGNFKFLGMTLPWMWSLVKYNFPSKTRAIPQMPRAALAQTTSVGSSLESLQSSLEEDSEMGPSSSVSVPESESESERESESELAKYFKSSFSYDMNPQFEPDSNV